MAQHMTSVLSKDWADSLSLEDIIYIIKGSGRKRDRKATIAQLAAAIGGIVYHDVGSGGSTPVDVSSDSAAIVGITFGTTESSTELIEFAISGVNSNTNIRAIILHGGIGSDHTDCNVTIDANSTVSLPKGNSAIVLVDRYQNSLILRCVLLPATTATAVFKEVQSISGSQGGSSSAKMNSEGFKFENSNVQGASVDTFYDDGKLKTRVGAQTSYAEMSYNESDGPSVKVSSGSQGGGAAAEVLPGEVSVSNGHVEHLLTNNDANMLAAMKRNEQGQTYPTSLTMSYFLATEGVGIRIVSSSDSSTVDLDGNDYSVYAEGAFVFIANAKSETVTVSGTNSAAFNSVTIDPGHGRFFVKTSEGFFAA